MNNQTFVVHVKFQETDKSAITEKIIDCIKLFETQEKGYKFFGQRSSFPTPRFTAAFSDLEKAQLSFEDFTQMFKNHKDSVTWVIYTKENDNITVERSEGKTDDSLVKELSSVDIKDIPVNCK